MRGNWVAAGLLAGALGLASGAARAEQMPPGFYGGLAAGALFLRDVDGPGVGTTLTLEYDTGYTIGGMVGYRFGNGFRVEGEFSYGRTSLESVKGGGMSASIAGGDVDLYWGTVGAFYDFDTGSIARPYIGGTIGFIRSKTDSLTLTAGGTTSAPISGDSSTDLTLSADVGVGIAITRRAEIVPSYRFQWVSNGGDGVDDNTAHVVRLGFRYSFQ